VKRACVGAGRKNESKVKANKIAHVKDVYTVNDETNAQATTDKTRVCRPIV